ncbi:MAG: hypothetical protein GY820_27935 [Gammaproteobacteria bacterium]|nr:hypothetical protein [Gammaproteobacteria bacterium]
MGPYVLRKKEDHFASQVLGDERRHLNYLFFQWLEWRDARPVRSMWRGSEQLVFIQEMGKVFRCDGSIRIADAIDLQWLQRPDWYANRPNVQVGHPDHPPYLGQMVLFEYDECPTYSKSSSHGLCVLCRQQCQRLSSRQQQLIDKNEERGQLLLQSNKVYALERWSECEWREMIDKDVDVAEFVAGASPAGLMFNTGSKERYFSNDEIVKDVLEDRLQGMVHMTIQVKKEYW